MEESKAKQTLELVEEAQPAGKEGEAATELVVAPATETEAPAPGEATEDKPEVVIEGEEEKKKEGGEEGEVKKEGESKSTEGGQGESDGQKDHETAAVTVEVERPGSKLSRIEEEPEVEPSPG